MRGMRKTPLALLVWLTACGAEPVQPMTPLPSSPPAASAPPPASKAQPQVVKRIVVNLSRKAGTNVTTTAPDGTITVSHDVLENGRGPHTGATVRLSPDGAITSLSATGHHEMGTPVAETFSRDGDRAQWKSHEEN